MTGQTTPAATGTDRPPLDEYDVTVTMCRGRDAQRETRAFTFTIPAADEDAARRGAVDMGLGINEASGYQWKLAGDEDGPRVELVDDLDDEPVHGYFGLTYANYQILHRSLMQSMPLPWQRQMVALLHQLDAAYEHLDRPDSYIVEPARDSYYNELTPDEMQRLDVTVEERSEGWTYYDRDGVEHAGSDRVLVPLPGGDPIPHYNRGRTRVPPYQGVDR